MGYIIALDPGKTTGLVIASNVNYAAETYDLHVATQVAWEDRAQLYNWLATLHNEALGLTRDLDAIVIEDFVLYANKAREQTNSRFPSVAIIERATVYAELLGCADKIRMQMAGLRKSVLVPEAHYAILRRQQHAMAAYQHLRYYFLSTARAKPKKRKS